MINGETAARLDRLLTTLELQAWRLTRQARQIFSEEAATLRAALGLESRG